MKWVSPIPNPKASVDPTITREVGATLWMCVGQLCRVPADTHILHELTTRPQKCDAEVLPLPGTDSTIQTSQRLEQN